MFWLRRIIFLYRRIESNKETINIKEDYIHVFCSGYLKLKNLQIVNRNQFFANEENLLSYLINGSSYSQILQKVILLENNLSKEESLEFVSFMLNNFIELNNQMSFNKFLFQRLINYNVPQSKMKRNSIGIYNIQSDTCRSFESNNVSEGISDLKIELEILNNSNSDNLLSSFRENSEKLKHFTYLGKNEIKRDNKVLTLEIYVRVDNDYDTIEFIFNDITKHDLERGLTQLIVKLGQFLHDFKNPLICIHNEISELKENNDIIFKILCKILEENNNIPNFLPIDTYTIVANKYEYIKNMSNYCQNMIASYEDLARNIFKPQELKIKNEIFDLKETLAFVNTMMMYKFSNKNNLQFILDDHIIDHSFNITSDENRIKQVLINLLSNSEKFTPRGEIKLTVEPQIIEGKRYIKFLVKDTGLGMGQDIIDKLFTPFCSLRTNNLNSNGCGLGLLIVKEITEKLGIEIKLTSELGKGTSMWFYVKDFTDEIDQKKRSRRDIKSQSYFSNINIRDHNRNSFSCEEISQLCENSVEEMIDIKNNYLKYTLCNNKRTNMFSSASPVSILRRYTQYPLKNPILLNPYGKKSISDKFFLPKCKFSSSSLSKNRTTSAKDINSNLIKIFSNIRSSPPDRNARFNIIFKHCNEIIFEILSSQKIYNKFYKENETFYLSKIVNLKNNNKTTQFNNFEITRNSSKMNSMEFKLNDLANFSEFLTDSKNTSPTHKKLKCSNIKTPITNKAKNPNLNSFSDFCKANLYSTNINELESIKSLSTPIDTDNTYKESLGKKVNVLIVDDMPSIRSNCVNLFKKLVKPGKIELLVDQADDGFSAFAKIMLKMVNENEMYDIIILDEELRFLNGSDLVKIMDFIIINGLGLKAGLNHDLFNSIFLCSSDSESVRKKLHLIKEDHIFEKPLNATFVKQLMKKLY